MPIKPKIIDECRDCKHLKLNCWIPPIWCKKAKRERHSTIGIPDWCPGPDPISEPKKFTPPRYDEVYFKGLTWLDRQGGIKMGGRYLVTGVQLVMLKSLGNKDTQELHEMIVENQFLFNSESEISVDIKLLTGKIEIADHPKSYAK